MRWAVAVVVLAGAASGCFDFAGYQFQGPDASELQGVAHAPPPAFSTLGHPRARVEHLTRGRSFPWDPRAVRAARKLPAGLTGLSRPGPDGTPTRKAPGRAIVRARPRRTAPYG